MNRGEVLRRVEEEVRQAKAQALGRLGEQLDALLAELARIDRQLLAMARDTERDHCRLAVETEARNRLRDEAAQLVQHLIIQREAIGFRRHGPVAERYPVPPRRSPAGVS